jgi:hypothetical protein
VKRQGASDEFFSYSVWVNFALTLDYQHVELKSNAPLQSFTRDVVTLGATHTY